LSELEDMILEENKARWRRGGRSWVYCI